MSAINCGVCGKRMVTEKILDAHMKKTHSGNSTETNPELAGVSEAPQESQKFTQEEKLAGYVIFKSLDDRALDVSINDQFWKGKTIQVTEANASEVRSLLRNGKYFFEEIK